MVAVPAAAQHGSAMASVSYPPYAADSAGEPQRVEVSVTGNQPGTRRFELSTTAPQRDGDPQRRTIQERAGAPFVASGNALFDALFAMAIDDARLASVSEIRDDAYDEGRPIPCHCFETGEKWHYVWTRDLSYALDLGLGGLDPERAVAGLLFKTSGFRPGVPIPAEIPDSSEQIIQDTGSGGSWPVSTDRVAWALGAERTLANLSGAARDSFALRTYHALRGTLEADRVAAYDERVGLYGGEQSFLDWREQTYAPWIVDDLPAMAQSKALSTNVLELRALRLAARLAGELGESRVSARYTAWADSLAPAIDRTFWMPDAGMYATFTTADRHPAPIEKYDLLGNALAILSGVADGAKARSILSHYPFAPFGPPVVWPEAPGMYVYHNRAIWPFVTAYALRAAARTGHVSAADRALESLMRGAALHLSNMENLEWLTGRSQFDDGPAINSRRQLWSIAAYFGAVTEEVFGWRPEADGVHIAPFLTSRTRELFGAATKARLGGLMYRGKPVEIVLMLPERASAGRVYDVREVRLNGKPLTSPITGDALRRSGNVVEIRFGSARAAHDSVTTVPTVPALSYDDPRVFMPATPAVSVEHTAGRISLVITTPQIAEGLRFRIYRDGRRVAQGITAREWSDPDPAAVAVTVCYSVVAVYPVTRLASQPSAPACLRGTEAQTIGANDPRMSGVPLLAAGDSVAVPTRRVGIGQRLTIANITIATAGDYAIAAEYDNHVYALNTGVTNAVKRLTVTDSAGTQRQTVLQMPHIRPIDGKHPIRPSTRAYMRLDPGTYTLELSDFFNMSALSANARYSGPGGIAGAVNEAQIAAVTIDLLAKR
ncbi:MAG TPA: hypothetical protein VFK04_14280 [Gemmatimonadaceae bacterium]|nr:hypothetical protein [Gemmatimonadaceae bacterium]